MTDAPAALLVVAADARPSAATERLCAFLELVAARTREDERHVLLLRGGPEIHRLHRLADLTVLEWYDRRDAISDLARGARANLSRRLVGRGLDAVGEADLRRHLRELRATRTVILGWEALERAVLPGERGRRSRPSRASLLVDLVGSVPEGPTRDQLVRSRLERTSLVHVDEASAHVVARSGASEVRSRHFADTDAADASLLAFAVGAAGHGAR